MPLLSVSVVDDATGAQTPCRLYLTDAAGAAVTVVPGEAGRANLHLRFGPDAPGGLLLSGHTDVVPAGSGWPTDPYELTEVDGSVQTCFRTPQPSLSATGDPMCHFGLGEAAGEVSIRVVWPDRSEVEVAGIQPDQKVEVIY